MNNNYYEILNIKTDASSKEMKNAYIFMLRKFPSEKHPNEFSEIQKAYALLQDEKKRKAYDIEILYGDKINQLKLDIEYAKNEEDFEKEIVLYRQLVEYFPESKEELNNYALCLFKSEEYEDSIKVLEKILRLGEAESHVYCNLGQAYIEVGKIREAIRTYKKGLLCVPLEFELVNELVTLYIELEEYEKAWIVLEKILRKCAETDPIQMIYINRLIQIAVISEDEFSLKIVFKYASKFIIANEYYEEDLLQGLLKTSFKLYSIKNYIWAQKIIVYISAQDEYLENLDEVSEVINNYANAETEYNDLIDDSKILVSIKLNLNFKLYIDNLDEDMQEEKETTYEAYYLDCEQNASAVLESKRRMRVYYPYTYKLLGEWLESTYKYFLRKDY